MERLAAKVLKTVRVLVLAIATPLLEKNASKTAAARSLNVPVVFSMARVIVLAFAISMVRQGWRVGIVGWPEATLSIAIVLAIPILGALQRVKPAEAVTLARELLARFGRGERRHGIESVLSGEPSKHDDQREDDASRGAGSDHEIEERATR
jgi:hypothetical protein